MFNSVVTDVEAVAMQKNVDEVNTVKKVAGTVGNAVRQFADFAATTAGLFMIVIAVVVFIALLIVSVMFLKSGQTIKSFGKALTGGDVGGE